MGVCTVGLLNKRINEKDVFEFVKNHVALDNDAKLEISEYRKEDRNEYGNLWGRINLLVDNTEGSNEKYRMIFFCESSGYDYKKINGGEECLYLSLGVSGKGPEIMKKIVEHFGGYYIKNDCNDEDKEGYAVYYRENPKYLSMNHKNSLESKLWEALTSDPKFNPLLKNFGLIKSLLKENPTLGNKEFAEGDVVYHTGLDRIGQFESWDIDDNTVNVTFEDEDGYEDYRRVSASALKKLI